MLLPNGNWRCMPSDDYYYREIPLNGAGDAGHATVIIAEDSRIGFLSGIAVQNTSRLRARLLAGSRVTSLSLTAIPSLPVTALSSTNDQQQYLQAILTLNEGVFCHSVTIQCNGNWGGFASFRACQWNNGTQLLSIALPQPHFFDLQGQVIADDLTLVLGFHLSRVQEGDVAFLESIFS